MSAFDLFLAGTETTSLALRYGMMALMGSPAIMGGASWDIGGIMGYRGHHGIAGASWDIGVIMG